MPLRVLFASSEAVPFAKTGGLADVAGALPKALAALGHDVRLILPAYRAIGAEIETRKLGPPWEVRLGPRSVSVTIKASGALEGVTTYLVDCPEFFDRDTLYGQPDDAERFALFCRATLEFVRQGKWKPQVIHSNDWQTGLIPVMLKTEYAGDSGLASIGTLHTIHNLAYQGIFERSVLAKVGLDESLFAMDKLEFYGQVNYLKGGLVFADMLNTVSKTYSQEIQTPEYGARLDGVLAQRRADLFGILNGIDYDEWNPATDKLIEAQYDARTVAAKAKNKAALQRRYKLPVREDVPLFGLVSRLAAQKGLDLLAEALVHLMRLDVQFAILGTGEPQYHELLSGLAARYGDKMGVALTFDNPLAHQVYAGADMFLMPSHYEPCGLGQMISLRYGTIPIVRRTGGLADTVEDYNAESGNGTGFVFEERSPLALMGAMARGMLTIKTKPAWDKLVQNAMAVDFSWNRSAAQYVDLYQRVIDRHGG